MALDIIWTQGAERDLLDLHRQCFAAFDGDAEIVDRFLRKPLESSLRLLREHPEIGPKVRGARRVRRRLLAPQNRYGLFYVVEQRGIMVHALLDLRQDPRAISKRLEGL